jgi:O-antigen/teichoic acid export membrane protein
LKIQIQTNINSFQVFQVLRFAAFLLISILLAKTGVATSTIGTYEYLLMLGGSVSFFWLGGFLTYYISKIDEGNNSNGYRSTFQLLFISNVIVSTLLFGLYFFFQNQFFPNLNEVTFWLFIVYHFTNNQSYINEHYLLLQNEQKKLLHYGILNFLIQLAGAGFGFYFIHGLNGILLGLSIVSILKMGYSVFIYFQNNRNSKLNRAELTSFVKQGLIISFSILLGSLGDYIDEYLVKFFYGAETYAVYKIGAREFPLLQLLTNSLATVLIVAIAKESMSEAMNSFKLKTSKLIRTLVPILCILILGSKYLFPLFYNQHFSESAVYFNLYTLLVFSRFLFPQSIIIGLGLNKYLMIASVVECILHIALSLALMQVWGVYGIIAGFLISYLIDKLLLMYFLYYKNGISPLLYTPIKDYVVGSLMIVLTICLSQVL